MTKKLILLLNGLCDLPLHDLKGETPLEKANTPHLDYLASVSECFTLTPHEFGGSERALLNLLGVNTKSNPISQGVLEAIAKGYSLSSEEYAYSLRFVTLGNGHVTNVSNSLLSDSEGKVLCQNLTELFIDEELTFLHLRGPQGVLISSRELFLDSAEQNFFNPVSILEKLYFDAFNAPLTLEVMEYLKTTESYLETHELNQVKEDLDEDKINGFLFFNGGRIKTENLELNSSSFLYSDAYPSQGIANLLKIPFQFIGHEKERFSNCSKIIDQLSDSFENYNTVFLEWNYLWRSTYNGDLLEKIKTIEWFDRNVVAPIAHHCYKLSCELFVFPLRMSSIQKGALLPGCVPALHYCSGESVHTRNQFSEKFINSSLPNISLKEFAKSL